MYMSKARHQPMMEWRDIDWHKLERCVSKLQKRIYRASQRGDVKAYRRLQKTLMKSWSARCLAVRRVTQDNKGKKTAGVDGIKSLRPSQRLELVGNLKLGSKVKPTRRVWIPKPGTDEKRPLGIPIMYDRALQALVKLALEPEWEAKFEPNSYGFRPGRSPHDAVEAIFNTIRYKSKYVLDADIAKCFDRISHEKLLKKLNTFPTIRCQIRNWLKAGVMDGLKSDASPYDGNLIYWGIRMGRHPEVPARVALLLKKQSGKCLYCDSSFKVGDLMEVDHIEPLSKGGKNTYNNLQLLHRHCHDKKTAQDAVGTTRAKRGIKTTAKTPKRKNGKKRYA